MTRPSSKLDSRPGSSISPTARSALVPCKYTPGSYTSKGTGSRLALTTGDAIKRPVSALASCGAVLLLSVLVVTAEPETLLVAPQWRPVEPLVHTPHGVEAAGVGGVGVVHGAVV